jgi:hypothetical protein
MPSTQAALLTLALAAQSDAAVVSGRNALGWVNHFIGTNDGSMSTGAKDEMR